jgi:adenosylcobinamide amidohydrolase
MAESSGRAALGDWFELGERVESGSMLSLVAWRPPEPMLMVSSAPLGGGIGLRAWIINVQVSHDYTRRDPDAHLRELASARDLHGEGVGMLTAVDVRETYRTEDDGAHAHVSVGVSLPTWAAAPDGASWGTPVGTINAVGFVPERLSPAALVNAVMSVTEAKAQALWEAGIAATGTASDAVCVACPATGASHAFGGPRSAWGARLARAVHRAVLTGCRRGTT